MLDAITRLAEKTAMGIGVSRRGFLVRAGAAALSAAGLLGAWLAWPTEAHAAHVYCCLYWCQGGNIRPHYNTLCMNEPCPDFIPPRNPDACGQTLVQQARCHSCKHCERCLNA